MNISNTNQSSVEAMNNLNKASSSQNNGSKQKLNITIPSSESSADICKLTNDVKVISPNANNQIKTIPSSHSAPSLQCLTPINPFINKSPSTPALNKLSLTPLQLSSTNSPVLKINNNQACSSFHFDFKSDNPEILFNWLKDNTPPVKYLSNVILRYSDIGCPEETAVQVKEGPSHLHANTVSTNGRNYIAAQCPPTPEAQALFLKAVFKQSKVIVDLTHQFDDWATCEYPYLPYLYPQNEKESKTFGSIIVTCNEKEIKSSCTVYKLTLVDEEIGQSKEITRIHYSDWADQSSTEVNKLSQVIEMLELYVKDPLETPFVHCLAGVGRTGTFITAYTLHHLVKSKKLSKDSLIPSIQEIILKGRKDRGCKFVQNVQQLTTIIEFGKKLLEKK
jgi:protein tyrosine phosphatase